MYVTGSPQKISLLLALASVGRAWRKLTKGDVSDASYTRAMELLICAGYVDAKVEALVTMQGRLGSIRLVYQCHGACYDLVDDAASAQARHVREWTDVNGMIVGRLTIAKTPLAVRLSAKSIDQFKLDRDNEKLKVVPLLVDSLIKRLGDSDDFLYDKTPEIVLLDSGQTARSGPDPDNAGVFYWNGTGHRLTQRNWQLLRAIYGHDEVNCSEVGEIVWGNDLTPESTIRAQLNRLNKQLGDLRIPLAWRIEAGQIVPEN